MNFDILPLVTIVTPSYNQADFLCETIDSVLDQSYPNIEYIVINDGSTDHTREMLLKYESKCTIIHQENMGQSATLNRGWAIGKGEILGYISSDDCLKQECVAESVAALCQDKDIIVTYCDFDLIDAHGNFIRSIEVENFSINRIVEDLICQPGPGAFFTLDALKKVGGWRTDLQQIPDFEFWLRLSQIGRFSRIPSNLAKFRIHDESGSVRAVNPTRSDEVVAVMEEFLSSVAVSLDRKKALSSALLTSARSHFQSRRYKCGFKRIVDSILSNPSVLARSLIYRSLFSGVFRYYFYRFRRSAISVRLTLPVDKKRKD